MRGVYVQHWRSTECSRSVFRLNNGWFISDDADLLRRTIYATCEQAMEAAARQHDIDLRRARRLVQQYGGGK